MKNAAPILGLLTIFLLVPVVTLAADDVEKPKPAKTTEKSEDKTKADDTKADPNESPLVRAAREGKATRDKEKSKISITNEDIKKSGGKIIQSSDKPLAPLPRNVDVQDALREAEAAKQPPKNQKQDDLKASVEKHQKDVDNLERELRRIEETYYNEDDPDYREDVLAQNFEETKKQLEAARRELAAARKALGSTKGN